MDQQWLDKFRTQLESHYAWPELYTFKFIVPKDKAEEVKILFPRHVSTEKPSKNGNYTSITFIMMMPSSEAVIEIYKAAANIEGIIAL